MLRLKPTLTAIYLPFALVGVALASTSDPSVDANANAGPSTAVSADATPAPGVNNNARAPTAASSLANDSVPICGRPSNQRSAQPETATTSAYRI